ncbi:MAG: hypothetical protein IJ148_02820 [Bacteroidaceae bacterium]|nr:hypothetical protein [Bacteroidaceae bacterium]MBQ9169744.1 hypothetical protein [Bacteroidaceae bacterium]
MKTNFFKYFAVMSVSAILLSSCSEKDEIINGGDSDDISVLPIVKTCTEWGTSVDIVKSFMKDYTLIADKPDLLKYKSSKNPCIISYDFKDGGLIATALQVESKGGSNTFVNYLKEYNYLGILSNATMYYNSSKNTIASTFKWTNNGTDYEVLGYVPIHSEKFDDIPPIYVTTQSATNVTGLSAEIGGSISGYNTSCTCGILYSKSSNMSSPTKKSKTATSSFSFSLTNLESSTTYYYQAYVTIDGISYYGNIESFTTEYMKVYSIGEWYPDDKKREGIVFYVTNNGHSGKIVAPDYAFLYWDSETLFASSRGCTSTTDGMSNTKKMPSSTSRTLAGPWCLSHGSGWYCPARDELVQLSYNIGTINKTLSSGSYVTMGAHYWSSTEAASNMAYVVCLGPLNSTEKVGDYFKVSKGQGYGVCAIKAF